MEKQRTITRTFCALLSMVMLLLTLAVFPAVAEDTSEDMEITPAPMEGIENLTSTSTTTQEPALLDITSGSAVMDVGKTYLPVHDDFEIASIYSFTSTVQVQTGNLLYANAIGSCQITILYYNESNILSTFSCQIEVMDVLGTIDVTRSNVFVEKGQKYILDFGGVDVYSVNIINNNPTVLNLLANQKVIEAVEADSVIIHYSYYGEGGTVGSAICNVDVFEAADLPDGEYVIKDNGSGLYISNNTTDCVIEGINPETLSVDTVRWEISTYSDGYCNIRSKNLIQYLAINENSITTNTDITLSYNLAELTTKWKILKDHEGRFIIIPQYGETQNMVLWTLGRNSGCNLALVYYYSTDIHSRTAKERGWDIYDDTKYYLNNYYDISFTDTVLTNYIPFANDFAINVFAKYSTPIVVNGSPIYADDHPLSICECSNIECSDSDNCSEHHIIASNYHNYNSHGIYRSKSHIVVMWANRTVSSYCDTENGVHAINAPGLAFGGGSTISFYYWPGTYHESAMAILLTHELAHVMGCPEMYRDPTHDSVSGMSCVMEYFAVEDAKAFYEYITESPERYLCAFCITCQNTSPLWTPFYSLTHNS